MSIIDQIVLLEWDFFEKIKKDATERDEKTFDIMRRSQFETWPEELLESYLNDIFIAKKHDWNLMMEKYARLMEYTHPDRYEEIKHILPAVENETREIISMIALIQDQWMKDFEKEYPRLAKHSRDIQAYEDSDRDLPYKTCIEAELMTYSPQTISLYGNMIVDYRKRKINLVRRTMEHAIKHYGFSVIDEAERKL